MALPCTSTEQSFIAYHHADEIQELQDVNLPGRNLAFHRQPLLPAQLLKVDDVFEVRDEANGVAAAVEAS